MVKEKVVISAADGLFVCWCDDTDLERFAMLFKRVWDSVPMETQNLVKSHWRDFHGYAQNEAGPNIGIFVESFGQMRKEHCAGVYESYPPVLRFYAPVITKLKPSNVRALVAHELAHVVQSARGVKLRPSPSEEQRRVLGNELAELIAYAGSPVEKEADEIAESWGFHQAACKAALKNIRWDTFSGSDRY